VPYLRLPARIFSQPFYTGNEKRVVYNYTQPIQRVPLSGCFCPDCLKRQEHYVGEDVEHHLFGMGVRPCYALPGYQLLRECYPFRSGHVVDYSLSLLNMPPNVLKRFRQYGISRQATIPVYTGIEVRQIAVQGDGASKHKRKKKKKVVVAPNRIETQLHGWLQCGGHMTQKRIIYPDSFPIMYYDERWTDVILSVYPRLKCVREGVGFKVFSPLVQQQKGDNLKVSKDDMFESTGSSRDSLDSLDLAQVYRISLPKTTRPWRLYFVSYGSLTADSIRVGGKVMKLQFHMECRSLQEFRLLSLDRPFCYLNKPKEGRVLLFSV